LGAYEFLALNGRGREQRGVLEGDSARQVRQLLRERGLSALEVAPVSGQAGKDRPQSQRYTLPTAELVVMTRQLATLARAGLPIGEVLATVRRPGTLRCPGRPSARLPPILPRDSRRR